MPGESTTLPNTKITKPYVSSSYQVSPGVRDGRPNTGDFPNPGHWYTGMTYGLNTSLNPFFYGVTLEHKPSSYTYQSDAISANTGLSETHFERMHKFRVEWQPPKPGAEERRRERLERLKNGTETKTGEKNGTKDNEEEEEEEKKTNKDLVSDLGYIRWYMDGKFMYAIDGANLDITGSSIPSEPMYLILNTAISSTWGFPAPMPEGCKCKTFKCGDPACECALPPGFCDNFPASFLIDSVRVYQAEDHVLACSTKGEFATCFI